MSLPFYIARRYIKSKKNSRLISLISLITVFGIAIGVAVLIIALTVLEGFEKVVENKIINFNEHIVISGFSNRNLPDNEEIRQKINKLALNNIVSITPFISKNVIIGNKKDSEGVLLFGISDSTDLNIKDYIIDGEFSFGEGNNTGIIIGKKLTVKLNLNVGSKLTILALKNDKPPSLTNPPALKQFVITGIYESGMAEYDDLRVFVSKETADYFLDMQGMISGYNIKIKSITKIDSVEQVLQRNLSYPYYVQSIFKKHQNIFTWLELQKKPIPIILGMVIIVAAFNMIGTILMIVLERTPDIGILRSLGIKRNQILKLFLYQGTYLALIGVLLGNIIAIVLSVLQLNFDIISLPGSVYFITTVPFSLNPLIYLIVSIVALLICFITTMVPGFIASKINIINAVRFS